MIRSVLFALGGSLEGKTITLGNYSFVNGLLAYTGSDKEIENLGKYLNLSWQCRELTVEEVKKLAADGSLSAEMVPPEAPVLDKTDEEPNLAQQQQMRKIVAALKQLDSDNDDHWTKVGKPSIVALEGFYGSNDLTRAMIEAAAPGFNRDVAHQMKAGDNGFVADPVADSTESDTADKENDQE